MPRGFSGVRQASAEVESRRSSGGPTALWFRLEPDEEAIVRFLEQNDDVFYCYVHEVPVEGRSFGRDVTCGNQDLDGTPCPGCERELPRKFKGYINVIWDNAPVFKRDSEGKLVKENGKPEVVSRKPQVAIWGSGIRVFEELDEINTNFRGLRSRPFRIKRKGKNLSTKYQIVPAEVDKGPQEFSSEEKELEGKKYDLNEYTKPPSYDEFLKELGERKQNQNNQQNGGDGGGQRKNPFMRNR